MLPLFQIHCAPLEREFISESWAIDIWPLSGPETISVSNPRDITLDLITRTNTQRAGRQKSKLSSRILKASKPIRQVLNLDRLDRIGQFKVKDL